MTSVEFGRRIVHMQETLYRVAYGLLLNGHDSADAVQECILKAWQKQHKLRDPDSMKQWVVRILINECYNIMRTRKRVVAMESLPEAVSPPDADAALHDAVAALDEKLRLPIILQSMCMSILTFGR